MRVTFVFNEYALHNHVIRDYVRARPDDVVSVVKVPLVLRGKSRSATASRIVPKLSRRFLWGKLLEGATVLAITAVPKMLSRGAIFERLSAVAKHAGLPFHASTDVMADATLDFIRAQRPDLVVTLFHQIVREPLIEIPRLGVVNIHPGLLPDFRGIQPYFWALSEGAHEAGATFHFIEDESIDTGAVIARTRYAIPAGVSVQLNYFLTCQAVARALPVCVAALEGGTVTPRAQSAGEGAYYRWPDGAAFDRLRAREHALFSWRQLFGILTGRHDEVAATVEVMGPCEPRS